MAEVKVGKVSHYFSKIGVAAIRLTDGELRVGDTIHLVGHTTNLTQVVDSIQIEHQSVSSAAKGQDVGIRVKDHAREHDDVFVVVPE